MVSLTNVEVKIKNIYRTRNIWILKVLGLINNIEKYQNIWSCLKKVRLKKIDEIRNYLIEQKNQNRLMSKKHKKGFRVLNYIDHSLIVISTIIGFVSISAFASFVGIPIGITSSAIGLKICTITAGIKKY